MQVFPQVGSFVSRVDPDRGRRRAVPPGGRRARLAGRPPRRARPGRRRRAAGQPRRAAGTGHRPRGVLRARRGVPPRPAAAERARQAWADRRRRPRATSTGRAGWACRRTSTATAFAAQHVEIFDAVARRATSRAPARRCARTCGPSSTTSSGIREHSPELFATATTAGAGPTQRRRLGVTTARGCAAA